MDAATERERLAGALGVSPHCLTSQKRSPHCVAARRIGARLLASAGAGHRRIGVVLDAPPTTVADALNESSADPHDWEQAARDAAQRWKDGWPVCPPHTLHALHYAFCGTNVGEPDRRPDDPSEEEIAERCARVRDGWSTDKEAQRERWTGIKVLRLGRRIRSGGDDE